MTPNYPGGASNSLPLEPPFEPADQSAGRAADALWVGGVDLDRLHGHATLRLRYGEGLGAARLLVWEDERVRGFLEMPIHEGALSVAEVLTAAAALPSIEPADQADLRPVSVVVCTRDRPQDLARCLQAMLRVEHPDFEVLVVDNASRSDEPRKVVEALADARVRYLREDTPGLARARNTGVRAARRSIVAFTDDDVVVDRRWLQALCRGFSLTTDVSCVTGLVPSGQLGSRSQRYFDRRVTWARSTTPTVYDIRHPPEDMPLFPFQFGVYGTGANFAARRSVLLQLGGFDEALGVGSPTGGGEDIDFFVRVLLGGHLLAYQPDAVVWHRHRADDSALAEQLYDYGLGLGAVVTKLLTDRVTRRAVVRRIPHALRHLPRMLRVQGLPDGDRDGSGLARTELTAMLHGPGALRRARRQGRPRPLGSTSP